MTSLPYLVEEPTTLSPLRQIRTHQEGGMPQVHSTVSNQWLREQQGTLPNCDRPHATWEPAAPPIAMKVHFTVTQDKKMIMI